ncbi:uncharacterized protein LY89DRAFT_690386 [Mollisia scopiformis]|uniref:Uncharacterized protein n=1 Tax=Mollisia scopiformis TaxID=149040 RepID=A0A132BAA9_MOLSC|nr:uncharacterized protein LY89DRAFT_690386 [Mollisia scopiformis]KUJ09340.1 hypothetical protein LY89DRAFT_690386 [Mollisia scopiformis]
MVYPSAMGMVSEASADPAPAPVPEYDLNDLDNLVLSRWSGSRPRVWAECRRRCKRALFE